LDESQDLSWLHLHSSRAGVGHWIRIAVPLAYRALFEGISYTDHPSMADKI
jgi:hypothetical protein